MKENIKIRLAKKKDLVKIKSIYDQARRFMIAMNNPNQWGFYYPEEELTAQDQADKILYVVEDLEQDLILGVFVFSNEPEPAYKTIKYGKWLNEDAYCVVKRMASAGYGAKFSDIVFDWCKTKSGNLKIDTHRDNYNMRKSLIRNKFLLCGSVELENGEERVAFQWKKTGKK